MPIMPESVGSAISLLQSQIDTHNERSALLRRVEQVDALLVQQQAELGEIINRTTYCVTSERNACQYL
jgi:uncharacterized protein (DUF1501 family)